MPKHVYNFYIFTYCDSFLCSLSHLTTFISSALQVTFMVQLLSATLFRKVFKSVDDLSSPGEPWTLTSSPPVLGWPARMSHHVRLGLVEKISKNLTEWLMPILHLLRDCEIKISLCCRGDGMAGGRRATTQTPRQTSQPGYGWGRQEAEPLVSSLSCVALIKYRGYSTR